MMHAQLRLDRPVLVVDDTNSTRYATTRALKAAGLDVLEATTGGAALELAPGCAAVILDVNLPDIDGFEVCRRLRADAPTRLLPVLHLSAQHMQDADKVVGLDAGADAYLTHPVSAGVLVATLRALVRAREAEHAQARIRGLLETVVAGAPVGIGVFDDDVRFLHGNDLFRRYVPGVAESPPRLPQVLQDALVAVREKGVAAGTTEIACGGDALAVEWRVSRADGSSVMVLTDRTREREFQRERERLHERERIARAEAEAASQTKDAFLALVSHELRNPLNSISMWASMLRRPEGASRIAQGLASIERSAHLQARLLGDLLDVARISAGKLGIVVVPMDLRAVLEDAIESVSDLARVKNLRLVADLDDLPPTAGDASRLHQVAWNLLSNAIKFSEPGARIDIRLHAVGGDAVFAVEDTGAGFEPDTGARLFERFRQGAQGRHVGAGGLGLGLAIVREIVQQHGGSVTARSAGPGLGARFEVRLPLARPLDAASVDESALRGSAVLLIEDDAEARHLLKVVFEEHGARVDDVGSAELALDFARRRRFDLVVSDVGLPTMDGLALLPALRNANPALRDAVAIAVTAYARVTDVEAALAAGFDAHLAKPVDITALLRTASQLIGQGRALRAPDA